MSQNHEVMKTKLILILTIVAFTVSSYAQTTRYVSPGGTHTPPFTSLATAANDIQSAVNVSVNGDLILVDDGTYILSANISITKAVTVRSINGYTAAIIDGNNAVRCIYLSKEDAVVDGFNIINGYNPGSFGGGVDISNGGTVQNCLIENNQARDGGGVAVDNKGYVLNCIIRNNEANNNSGAGYGGGVRLLNNGEIRNCLIYGNTSVKYGGGINIWNGGKVYNCTVTDNTAPYGAGIRTRNNSLIKNTILYFNNGNNWEVSGSGYHYYNCCTTPSLEGGGFSTDCIADDPLFVNASIDDYHLQSLSPCKDVGYNMGWMTTGTDLDGNNRIIDVTVDIGCYELPTSAPPDSDGDGIPDALDDFPDDPNAAFLNYFPVSGFGSLAYEDLWPGTGDYDFNDIVVDYRFAIVTNADNKVYYIAGTFPVKASGAYLKNGFGFNLPDANTGLNTDLTISGSDLQEGYIAVNGNGLESGQAHPTIIVFDDVFNILPHPGIGLGVNTEESAPFVPYDTVVITMTPVADTYTVNDFSLITWNPFIIVDHDRGVEVHLPDHLPTDLVDPSIFGTFEDDSDPATDRYYKTVNNLPWAINIVYEFDWPIEKVNIGQAYLHFVEWAESDGASYFDWYEDLPGYRNDTYIYTP